MAAYLKTVIIPAAGRGTRLLPLTKVVPKEMLPVHDRPVLQFALEEAVAVGAERIIIVIHPSKSMIRDYLRRDDEYLNRLRGEGQFALAEKLDKVGVPEGIEVVFAMQDEALGLGHAVLCAAPFILPGPLGVILPDDVIIGQPALAEMARAYDGGHMIAAMSVPMSETPKYGIFVPDGGMEGEVVPARGMVEKPALGHAPSTLAAVGRYILDPAIMRRLAVTKAGRGGEIQLTDAIAEDAGQMPLTAFRFSGGRHDCGSQEGLVAAGLAQLAANTRRGSGFASVCDPSAESRKTAAR
jgi:UTP--glucose-1-phosphate uridylyltransferase